MIKRKKLTHAERKERAEKAHKFMNGLHTAGLWLTHVITFVLLIFSYILLPIFYNAVSANAWSVIIGIFLIPISLALAAGAALMAIYDLVRSAISKKWWHITIACIEVVLLILIALTVAGVVPVIGIK